MRNKLFGLVCFCFTAVGIFAQGDPCAPLEGVVPHEKIKVLDGSCVIAFEAKDEKSFTFPLGKVSRNLEGKVAAAPEKLIQGKYTRFIYVLPAGIGVKEAFDYYKTYMKEMGYEIMFTCKGSDCSMKSMMGSGYLYQPENRRDLTVFNDDLILTAITPLSTNQMYLNAKGRTLEEELFVSVYLSQNKSINPVIKDRTILLLDILERNVLEEKVLSASEIKEEIDFSGKYILEALPFETGSAEIHPSAEKALAELLKYLQEQNDHKFFLVGHSDAHEANKEEHKGVCLKRAQSLMSWLNSQGFDTGKIQAQSAGMLSPKSSNHSEAGRTLNRRVELVLAN